MTKGAEVGGRRPSMGDVARRAGVSPQTVSRVSNGGHYVSQDKRDRVLQAMRELGYRPNAAARAMKSGMFHTIGVIYDSLHPVGNHRTLEAISEVGADNDYATILIPLQAGKRKPSDVAFTRLAEMTMDALIAIVPWDFYNSDEWHLPENLPTVLLGPPLFAGATTIDFDQTAGTTDAVNTLLDLGHDTIYHVAGPKNAYSALAREAAWRSALVSRARSAPPVYRGDWSAESGYRAGQRLFEECPQVTAIFAANDQMALGIYRAANERGLRIPTDVSIIGFDNIDESAAFTPPLTTISQDWNHIGQLAFDCAIRLLEGEEPQHMVLPTTLVPRDSCAPPPC